MIDFHLLKNINIYIYIYLYMCLFPLLLLKGICHYWTQIVFLGGLSKWKLNLLRKGHLGTEGIPEGLPAPLPMPNRKPQVATCEENGQNRGGGPSEFAGTW